MTDLLEKASDWLGGVLRTHVAQRVEIRRGTDKAYLSASFGRTEWEVFDAENILVRTESRDFGILARDYAFNGTRTEPQRGDEIRWFYNGTTYVYRVVPFGTEEMCFRYVDRYRRKIRVYAKEVSTE